MNNIDLDINDMQMYAEKFQRSHDNKQRMIIISTPMHHESFFKRIIDTEIQKINIVDNKLDTSEYQKAIQSARDDGHKTIYIDSISENIGIHAEHIKNENIFFGISRDTFEPMIFENNITHNLNKEYEEKQQYQEFAINELKELPKKKKTFQENFGYVKRKFR